MKYQSLNDAARAVFVPGFAKGPTRIWYMRPEAFREYIMGYDWLRDHGIPVPDPKTIGQTHIKLGAIKETDLDRVFFMMQGESWSPKGEARDLIRDLGLAHTSMSVGDIIQTADGELLMVDQRGFRSIHKPRRKNVAGRASRQPHDTARDFVEIAEGEARRAASESDPKEAVSAAIVAAYDAGAGAYLARYERKAELLDRSNRVFFDVYKLAQRLCGRPIRRVLPTRASNPASPWEWMLDAVVDAKQSLARAKQAETVAHRIYASLDASLHAGAMWAFAKVESGRKRSTAHARSLAKATMARADRYRDEAKNLVRDALQSLGDVRWSQTPRAPNPAHLKRSLLQ